jgi:hypothetical protein
LGESGQKFLAAMGPLLEWSDHWQMALEAKPPGPPTKNASK